MTTSKNNTRSAHLGSEAHSIGLKTSLRLALILAGLTSTTAMAHIIPVALGTYDGIIGTQNLVGGVKTGNNGVTGNYGWIDGADGDWGDTHKIATYTFTLTGTADVTLKFEKRTNAFGGTGLVPGFTLYQGKAHNGSDHDYSIGSELIRTADCAATPGCTSTEGSLRSQQSFRITEDADPTGTSPSVFTYIGSAYDGSQTLPGANSPLYDSNPYLVPEGDNLQDGIVSMLFEHLGPGNYIAMVGGALYTTQTNNAARGVFATLTVTPSAPVPLPAAVWLFGSALGGFVGFRRKALVA